MSQRKTEAVVLRGVDFSETSRIVTFLTPDQGRVACMAKGVRRKNSRMSGALDTFNHVDLVYHWKEGREVQTLAEAGLLNAFTGIKKDIEKTAYAAYALELASCCAHENQPSEALFGALLRGMRSLDEWRGGALWHANWQTLALLDAAGFAPELGVCIHTGKAVQGSCRFSYDGGVCLAPPADTRLSAAALGAMRQLRAALLACPPEPARHTPDTAAEVFSALRQYAAHHTERDFKSIRVIGQLLGN